MPGIGKLGSGKLTFRGCFHDMPWGVQTHMYVPFGVDLRHKYQIKGNQPGEPPEPKELGSNAPAEGLYLRVDCQIKCNMAMVGFVKKEMKAASKAMVERMLRKAELIDAGVLQAMFDDKGKLTTVNPNDRTTKLLEPNSTAPNSPGTFHSVYGPNGINLRSPSHPQSAYARQSSYYPSLQQGGDGLAIEMPASSPQYPSGARLHPNSYRDSTYSEVSGSSPIVQRRRWSSVQSDAQSSNGSDYSRPTTWSAPEPMRSPMMNPSKSFAVELPGSEVPPSGRSPHLQTEERRHEQQGQGYGYNPQDYVGIPPS